MAWDWEVELLALAALSDHEAAAAINAMTVEVRNEYRITYRTILSATKDPANVEAIAAGIKAQMPTVDGMLREYSAEGGVDIAFPETRAFIQGLVGTGDGKLSQAQADAICALGIVAKQKYSDPCSPGQVHSWRAQR
jgi:hypothetical protein